MDFKKMNGYEFEDFIHKLVKQMGMETEATSYAGDGGIDIIARYDHPIMGGKYIIQCKNWVGNVGQPAVRDLYGTVVSEQANRGILISTSDFTEQAYRFAMGKNIELVNKQELESIIDQYGIADSKTEDFNSIHFYDIECFNSDRYNYLKSKIDISPKDYSSYIDMVRFLFSYTSTDYNDLLQEFANGGLFDAILSYLNSCESKACIGSMKNLYIKNCRLWKAQVYMMTGKLDEVTRIAFEYHLFYLPLYPNFYPSDIKHSLPYSEHVQRDSILASNLYAFFKQIGFEKGAEKIRSKMKVVESPEEYLQNDNRIIFLMNKEDLLSEYSLRYIYQLEFLNGNLDDVFFIYYPEIEDKKEVHLYVDFPKKEVNNGHPLNITTQPYSASSFIESLYNEEKDDIIAAIETAFRQLDI